MPGPDRDLGHSTVTVTAHMDSFSPNGDPVNVLISFFSLRKRRRECEQGRGRGRERSPSRPHTVTLGS